MADQSTTVVGRGDFQFRWIRGWGKLEPGQRPNDVPGIAVDSRDRVFVFQRGEPPILVFDRKGALLNSWGEGLFKRPHGLYIDGTDAVYCVDDEGQSVRKFTADGRLLLEIKGEDQSRVTGYRPGYPESVVQSAPPFCYPTGAALAPDRETLVVTDGYGNARIHRFDVSGSLVDSFGDPGRGRRQFVIPHGIHIDPDGTMYVSDRENERAQIFTSGGEFVGIWPGLNCPNNIVRDRDGYYYVAELGRNMQGAPGNKYIVWDAIRARVTVRDPGGRLVADWEAPDPSGDGIFFAPHGIAVDSLGDLYVGEVVSAYSGGLAPAGLPTLHKFVRVR
jgi:DNA-binding beta-propeller fold protein YncE